MNEGSSIHVDGVAQRLDLAVCAGADGLSGAVSGALCSDLLSFVMANGRAGNLWLTIQTHPNIVAVAELARLSAIVVVSGFTPDEDTLMRADEESIPVLTSPESAFTVAGRLYGLGVR